LSVRTAPSSMEKDCGSTHPPSPHFRYVSPRWRTATAPDRRYPPYFADDLDLLGCSQASRPDRQHHRHRWLLGAHGLEDLEVGVDADREHPYLRTGEDAVASPPHQQGRTVGALHGLTNLWGLISNNLLFSLSMI
jgi:hypothetical protein